LTATQIPKTSLIHNSKTSSFHFFGVESLASFSAQTLNVSMNQQHTGFGSIAPIRFLQIVGQNLPRYLLLARLTNPPRRNIWSSHLTCLYPKHHSPLRYPTSLGAGHLFVRPGYSHLSMRRWTRRNGLRCKFERVCCWLAHYPLFSINVAQLGDERDELGDHEGTFKLFFFF
jgi:hypothetical protein